MREAREHPGYQAVYFIQKEERKNSLYVALTPTEKDVHGYNRRQQSSGRMVEMKLKYNIMHKNKCQIQSSVYFSHICKYNLNI